MDGNSAPRRITRWFGFTEVTPNGTETTRPIVIDVTQIRAIASVTDPRSWRQQSLLRVAGLRQPILVNSSANSVLARLAGVEGSTVAVTSD